MMRDVLHSTPGPSADTLAAVQVALLDGDSQRPMLVVEQRRRPGGGWEVLAVAATLDPASSMGWAFEVTWWPAERLTRVLVG